jgi:alpha-galactosidase
MCIQIQTKSDNNLKLDVISVDDGITDIEIKYSFDKAIIPKPLKIKWVTKSNGSYMMWNPIEVYEHEIKPNWNKAETRSCSTFGMPMQQYISANGTNAVMVFVLDVQTPIKIRSGVSEETGNIEWELVLFSEPTEEITEYATIVRIDERKRDYEIIIRESTMHWQKDYPLNINTYAFEPVYSTWYSYHQLLSPDLIIELRAAAKLGMKTVIIDDGWQTDDNGRGYAYCGAWKVARSKIPNMRAFVDQVHEIGMKVMLWYSVPFVGIYSEVWEMFCDKLLYNVNEEYGVLDPRYSQVREYLISIYERDVKAWDLDGLKLDFIDSFALRDKSQRSNSDMDILALDKAVCKLLEDIYSRLMAIKSDILIEFRQNYVGPIMMTYGNMLRAADCPMDALTNRIRTVNLRLISGLTAVHSDMLMWNYEDSVEIAAEQFINILFSVPQVSMRIEKLPKEQYAMLQFYLKLWKDNRETIVKGEFHACHPELNYTQVYVQRNDSMVASAYGEKMLHIKENINNAVLVNGTGTVGLYLETEGKQYHFTVYNCIGDIVEKGVTSSLLTRLDVPAAGVVTVKNDF